MGFLDLFKSKKAQLIVKGDEGKKVVLDLKSDHYFLGYPTGEEQQVLAKSKLLSQIIGNKIVLQPSADTNYISKNQVELRWDKTIKRYKIKNVGRAVIEFGTKRVRDEYERDPSGLIVLEEKTSFLFLNRTIPNTEQSLVFEIIYA